jgi:hypothetical protein
VGTHGYPCLSSCYLPACGGAGAKDTKTKRHRRGRKNNDAAPQQAFLCAACEGVRKGSITLLCSARLGYACVAAGLRCWLAAGLWLPGGALNWAWGQG